MRKDEFLEQLVERFSRETEAFLMLCGEDDRKFFSIFKKKRKTEDYARLITVAAVLCLRGAVMKITKMAERTGRLAAMIQMLEIEGKKYENICRWMEDFIAKIGDAALQRETEAMWREKKADFEARGTRIEDIFF